MRDVVFKFMAEVLDHAAHGHGCCISEGANRTAHDVLCHVVEQSQVAFAALTTLNACLLYTSDAADE